MAMKSSEKGLLAATVVIALVAAGYYGGLADRLRETWESVGASRQTVLEAQTRFLKVKKTLERETAVRKEYEQKVARHLPPRKPGLAPEGQFVEDVDALCRSASIPQAQIEPAQRLAIPGIQDYEYITVNVRVLNQPWDHVLPVLLKFHEKFFLIKTLNLNSVLDQPIVKMEISLARVVQVTEEERKQREEAKKAEERARSRVSAGEARND